jgi:Concanavalin A-like lectin/glucanases superfamily
VAAEVTATHPRAPALALLLAGWVALATGCGGGSSAPGSGSPAPVPSGSSALRFFGTGSGDVDRVKIALTALSAVNVGATDFTVEFWIKGNAADNLPAGACSSAVKAWIFGNIAIDRDVYGNGDFGDYGVSLFDGRVAFGVSRGGAGATLCGTRNVLDAQWHHIALIRRAASGEMALYVDGVLDAHLPSSTATSGNLAYNVGRATQYPNSDPFLVFGAEKHDAGPLYPPFTGLLDEVRISTVVRYSGPFTRPAAPFAADASTAALYHFDEGSGTTVGDAAAGVSSPGVLKAGGAGSAAHWVADTPF